MKKLTLQEKFVRMEDCFIGVWRFHHVNKVKPQFCCTFRFNGNYYDTYGKPTVEAALDAAWKNFKEIKRRFHVRSKFE